MIIRCKVVGSGVPGDGYRVPYPTYRLIQSDGNNPPITHIIEVPNDTVPDSVHTAALVLSNLPIKGKATNVVTQIPANHMAEWYAHLDNMYQEHAGKFRHNVQ